MILQPLNWPWEPHAGVPVPAPLAGVPQVFQTRWQSAAPQADRAASELSAEERARLARFRQPADRLRFLAGRMMVRRMLGAHFGQPPAAVAIRLGEHGKPWAEPPPGRPPLHFNIAHAGDLVLAAFSQEHEVGVDVEVVVAAPEWTQIAPRLMPAAAHREWLALPPAKQNQAFFEAWTAYEAALKALGLALADDFSLPAQATLQQTKLVLPPGYVGALAHVVGS